MQTFTGIEYLKIDIANNFGLDKKDWNDRIAWVDANEENLELLLSSELEAPALYFAAVQAYRQVQKGEAIGYPVSLDATASGLQILACLTGDRKAAEICNVVDTGHRRDAYTSVFQAMCGRISDPGQITRDMSKSAVMKSLYGSTAEPKKVFGEGEQLDAFYATMEDLAPAAWELNQAFLSMWNSTALSHDWVLPDNFHVHVKVMREVTDVVQFLNTPYEVSYKVNLPEKDGRGLGANTVHSIDGMIVREITRRCNYDPKRIERLRYCLETYRGIGVTADLDENDHMVNTLWAHYQASGYLSARILDHLNMDNMGNVDQDVILELLDSLPAKPFKVIANHDCFRFLPSYGNEIRRQYNLQLMLIARSNLLEYLVSQIVGHKVEVFKTDPDLWKDIMAADYALS